MTEEEEASRREEEVERGNRLSVMSDPDQLTDSGHNSLQSSTSNESQPVVDVFIGKIGGCGHNPTFRHEVTVKKPPVNNSIIEVRHRGKAYKRTIRNSRNKTKVISADLLDFYLDFEDIYI